MEMMIKKKTKIGIVGGGIGGLTAALSLEHFGFTNYEIYEQAPELKEVGAAISVWPNALRVFKKIGIYENLSQHWGEISEAFIKTDKGKVLSSFKPSYDLPAVCMHRANLHSILCKKIPETKLFRDHPLERFEQFEQGPVTLHFRNGLQKEVDILIGADGIHSATRQQIVGDGKPIFRGYNIWRGVAELDVPQGYASETWGEGARVGIVPIKEHTFGWWATLNEAQDQGNDPEEHKEKLKRTFGNWHPPIPDLFESSPNIIKNALYDRLPRKGWSRGKVVLLGDAAHPTTPNLGQGGCMAIEGAYLLSNCLATYDSVPQAFERYEHLHFPRTKAVVKESLMNGQVGQVENSLLISLRNQLIRSLPSKATAKMLDKYFSYDVTKVEV